MVGVAVGLAGAAVYALAQALNVPPLPAAVLAVAATVIVTGALHEDGMADVADGFGGGATVSESSRSCMTAGSVPTACARSFFRSCCASPTLTNFGNAGLVAAVLVTAHAAARAPIPAFMSLIPAARADGMSADAGRHAAIQRGRGDAARLPCAGRRLWIRRGVVAVIVLCAGFGFMAWLCNRQIGGQTGDVLGALEQVGEIAVMLVAAAAVNSIR